MNIYTNYGNPITIKRILLQNEYKMYVYRIKCLYSAFYGRYNEDVRKRW